MISLKPCKDLANHKLRTVHTRLSSLLIPGAKRRGFPKPPPRFNNLLQGLTGLTGNYYTDVYSLLQGKDIDENQPKEEVQRVESGKVPKA